jgi:hypothetical protein
MRRWWDGGVLRRVLQVVAVLVALVVAAACFRAMTGSTPTASDQTTTPTTPIGGDPAATVPVAAPTPTSVPLGVYGGPGGVSAVRSLGEAIGTTVSYALDYFSDFSWETVTDPIWALTQWSRSGDRMIWGVPMLPASGASLAQGAAGQYDSHFVALARTLVSSGQGSSTLMLGFDPDQLSNPWSVSTAADAAAYVTYWQRIVTAMRQVPGAAFSFEWTLAGTGPIPPTALYPGGAYVDAVATGVTDTVTAPVATTARWAAISGAPTGPQWFATFAAAHEKPLSIVSLILAPATTPGGGGDDPLFVQQLFAWAAQHQVAIVVVWDFGPSAVAGGAFPASLDALAHLSGTGGQG